MPAKTALPVLFLSVCFTFPAFAQESTVLLEDPREPRRAFRRLPALAPLLVLETPPVPRFPVDATAPVAASQVPFVRWTSISARRQSVSTASAAAPQQPGEAPPIADNSFLIEEAYNQEYGVVQHISTFFRNSDTGDLEYTFTQEWPLQPAPRHQLSFTIPVLHTTTLMNSRTGVGDIVLNWRYQLLGSGADRTWFSPRFSLVLPSGDSRRGRGAGALGYQINLPLSVRAARAFVTHWNTGATITPGAKNEFDEKATTYEYFLGSSFIWLAHPRLNLLLETLFTSSQSVTGPNRTEWSNSVVMNPGLRWAWNFESGLQIVPGFGFPVEIGRAGRGEWGIFLYLSFEHAFRREAK